MGVITTCCTKQSIIQGTSISIYSLSEEDNKVNEKEIPTMSDINHALKFITSKDYYSLLLKNIPKHIISKKICLKFNNIEIFSLINNLFDWIQKEQFENCNDNIKKYINIIQDNTKISLKFILKEIKIINFNDKIEIFLLQSLTNISLIIQCLLYLVNQNNNEFNFNFWENRNIVNESKKYGFQAAYFLFLIKKKYNNKDNNENKITSKIKEEVNSFYKLSLDFTFNLINSE